MVSTCKLSAGIESHAMVESHTIVESQTAVAAFSDEPPHELNDTMATDAMKNKICFILNWV